MWDGGGGVDGDSGGDDRHGDASNSEGREGDGVNGLHLQLRKLRPQSQVLITGLADTRNSDPPCWPIASPTPRAEHKRSRILLKGAGSCRSHRPPFHPWLILQWQGTVLTRPRSLPFRGDAPS